ncbi:hypothetical protein PTKIN_Ptkin02bG0228500 [Pterospermum kingtungense]
MHQISFVQYTGDDEDSYLPFPNVDFVEFFSGHPKLKKVDINGGMYRALSRENNIQPGFSIPTLEEVTVEVRPEHTMEALEYMINHAKMLKKIVITVFRPQRCSKLFLDKIRELKKNNSKLVSIIVEIWGGYVPSLVIGVYVCFDNKFSLFVDVLTEQIIIGNSNNVYDFTYVENVAHAHIGAEQALASRGEVAGQWKPSCPNSPYLSDQALQDKNFDPFTIEDLMKLFEIESYKAWAAMELEQEKEVEEAETTMHQAEDYLDSAMESAMDEFRRFEEEMERMAMAELKGLEETAEKAGKMGT